jgi:hypothetical protein
MLYGIVWIGRSASITLRPFPPVRVVVGQARGNGHAPGYAPARVHLHFDFMRTPVKQGPLPSAPHPLSLGTDRRFSSFCCTTVQYLQYSPVPSVTYLPRVTWLSATEYYGIRFKLNYQCQ